MAHLSFLVYTMSGFSGEFLWLLLVPDPISVNIKPSPTLLPGVEWVSCV